MQALKLSHKSISEHAQASHAQLAYTKLSDGLIDLFPKPRYFQVHFQYLHENNVQLQLELKQLKTSVAQVDEKIERLLAMLG